MSPFVNKILGNLRDLDAVFRSNSKNLQIGNSKSKDSGGGLSFKNLRPYEYGDSHKLIDWRTTAKLSSPYIKNFEAEKNQPLLIFIDSRTTMDFHSRGRSKREIGVTISALIANAYLKQNSPIGFAIFGSKIESYTPYSPKNTQLIKMITNASISTKNDGDKFNTEEIVNLVNSLKVKSIDVLIVSDFLNISEDLSRLNSFCLRYNVKIVRVLDKLEQNPSLLNGIALKNVLNGDKITPILEHNNQFENYPVISKKLITVGTEATNQKIYSICLA